MSGTQTVAVILAVLNEELHIDACLASLVEQTVTPDVIIIADGGSTDETVSRIADWQSDHPDMIHLIDNPHRHQAAGLTLAARATNADVLVRADGHTTFDPTYVSESLDALAGRSRVAVGGSQVGSAQPGPARAIAAAMTSRFAVGPAPYRHRTQAGEVDTVYLGTFRRVDFLELDGYRLLPSGAAEDADFYYRWRQRGWVVEFHPPIRSTYHPRTSYAALFKQFMKYGVAKADMLKLHGRLPHARPLAPVALVVLLAGSGVLFVMTGQPGPLVILLGAWGIGLVGVAASVKGDVATRLGATLATGVIHISYGLGLLKGLMRSARKIRAGTRTF
ncbi:MAG: glycosyltransferase [Acidimicrobiia bacterium]|nr:glycosyltransferase [Acidimicrobiia bacterium]